MPYYGHYQIHVITDDQTEPLTKRDSMKPCRAMMIDLGVDNFAAITDSIGKNTDCSQGRVYQEHQSELEPHDFKDEVHSDEGS